MLHVLDIEYHLIGRSTGDTTNPLRLNFSDKHPVGYWDNNWCRMTMTWGHP